MEKINNKRIKHQNQKLGRLSFPHFTEQERLTEFKNNPSLYRRFQQLDEPWKKRFLEFMTGKKTLPLTYDPFFKKLFQPDIYPERLSSLISSILGTDVTVCGILPNEESLLPANSMLIMDILVQLKDGSITNVEIQKIPYAFPAERMSCYSSDLVLRQYSRVKNKENQYSKEKSTQNAWLSLLTSETVDDLERLVAEYPWMAGICQDMADYLYKPGEVLNMFSEALRILDDNTAQYMVDEMKKEIQEKDELIAENKVEIAEKNMVISKQAAEIANLKAMLARKH